MKTTVFHCIFVQISLPGSLKGGSTITHLSVSGVKAVSMQHAPHTPTFSAWVTPLSPRVHERLRALWAVADSRDLPVTSYSPKDKPLSLLCYSSDGGTRRYFQGNLVSVIRWWLSDLLWIHKCRWRLSALVDGWLYLRKAGGLMSIRNQRQKKTFICGSFARFYKQCIAIIRMWKISVFFFFKNLKCPRLLQSKVLTLCTLSVNLSVSVVLEWRHAQLSLMALCSTCRLRGQGSTAPEADSHKQKLCVYWHQATTSLSPKGENTQKHTEQHNRVATAR